MNDKPTYPSGWVTEEAFKESFEGLSKRIAALEPLVRAGRNEDEVVTRQDLKLLHWIIGFLGTGMIAMQAVIFATLFSLVGAQGRLEAQVEGLSAGQERLEAQVEGLEMQVGELSAGQKRLEAQLEELSAGQRRLEAL